jgi:hypothetical protein
MYNNPQYASWSPPNRGYQPPPAPPQFRAPDVSAAALNGKGTVAQKACDSIAHAHKEYAKHIEATNAQRDNYTQQGYEHQIALFHETSAAKAVQPAVDAVHRRRDEAALKVDLARRALSPNGDAAAESRATRLRDRVIRQLDALDDNGQAFARAQQIVTDATPEELGTLLQELPAYMESRGSSSGWIEPLVAEKVPAYGQAKAQLQKADAAVQIVNLNMRHLQDAYGRGQTRTPHFTDPAGYDPDEGGE